MTKKTKRNLCLVLLITALSFSAAAFGDGIIHRPLTAPPTLDNVQNSSTVNKGNRKAYVRRGLLSPRLTWHLSALGNRLEKPGKERLTITGVLRMTAESQGREIVAVGEFPDRLRLVIQRGNQSRLITFNGEQATAAATPLASDAQDLIETLAYDTAEHFFAAQMQGNATRFLGARFRTDDGSNPNYAGPYFDVYKIADRIKTSGQERPSKLYYFNSDTRLLERVTYTINRDGAEIKVETSVSDWREIDGQQVPRRIERFENERSIFVLTIQSAQLGQRADDGIFRQ